MSALPGKLSLAAVMALALAGWCAPRCGEAGALPMRTEAMESLRVSNVDPPTLVVGKEAWLTVYGQGFSEEEAKVEVFVGKVKALEARAQSPRRLKARIPGEIEAGSASVTVKNPNGEMATLRDAIYFRAPGAGFSLRALFFRLRSDWRSFVEWFYLGGPVMYPLAAISFFGLAWAVHCLLVLRRSQIVPRKFMDALSSHLSQGDIQGATASCERTGCVFSRVILAGLQKVGESAEKVREAIGAAGSRESAHLHQKISYLANVGSISPMLGLLGTVFGMIMAFGVISSGDVRHYLLAAAIAQAMITTAAGLVIGIPAMALYFYFRGRLLRLVTDMEVVADQVAQTIIEKGEEA